MALEQWEIELRKQLQDSSSYDKPKEKSWEDRLREQISNIPPAEPHHHKPAHKKNNNTLMAFVIIVLLAGAVLFAYNMKTGAISNWINTHLRSTPSETAPPNTNPFPDDSKPGPTPPANSNTELKQLRIDLEKMKQDDAARYAELQKRLKWDNDRITLLGMLNNENWLVIRNEGPNSANYIYFNADWTLSRQPQYLQLSDADRQFLEKYRKK